MNDEPLTDIDAKLDELCKALMTTHRPRELRDRAPYSREKRSKQ